MIDAMQWRSLLVGLACAAAVGVACGGNAFTQSTLGEGGAGDGSVGSSSGGGSSGSDAGGGDAAGDGPGQDAPESGGGDGMVVQDSAPGDAIVLPDVFQPPPPHCGGQFACVPAVPPGWSGPVELYDGSDAPPACTPRFTGPSYDGNGSLGATPATCGCSCGAATGVQCPSPTLTLYAGAPGLTACTSTQKCASVQFPANVCSPLPTLPLCSMASGTITYVSGPGSAPTGGSCAASPSVGLAPVTWGVNARACASSLAPAQTDCAASQICAPVPASPYQSGLCVAQAGDAACPAGYPAKTLYYGGVSDTRTCAGCSCGPVTGASCSAKLETSTSTDSSCSASVITYGLPLNTCAPVQSTGEFRVTTVLSGGACAPSTPAPSGAATPTSPTTFCCVP
jgi:hypothetical protein